MCQTIKCFQRVSGQCIPIKSGIFIPCPQRKSDVTTILCRSILQRFPSRHRSRCSPIISIKRSQTLTTISAFRNSKDINSIRINLSQEQCLPQQFLPDKLFSFLPPTIVITFIRNLWNKVNGRSIIKIPANFQPCTPFPLLRARAMQIEK